MRCTELLSSLVNINVRLSLLPRHQVNKKHVNEIQYLNIRRCSLSLPYLQIPQKKNKITFLRMIKFFVMLPGTYIKLSFDTFLRSPLESTISLRYNPFSANPIKWSNTLKQFVGKSRQLV